MSEPSSLAAYLSGLGYFAGCAPDTLAYIAASVVTRPAAAGEILFLEGEPGAGLWIVQTGRVKIYKLNPQGQEHILRIFGDHDTFNDIPAFDGGPNPVNAAALSEAALLVIPTEVFQHLMRTDSPFATRVIAMLSRRVRGLVQQIEDLTLYSVTVRVARLLLKQAEDPALTGTGVTRAALAAHLATTPPTISTALRELEVAGAIAFNRHEIHIVDEDLLRSIAML